MFNSFFDGFISYGRADSKAFAAKLEQSLRDAGFNIWFDQHDIPLGVDFQNQIDDGIEKAHNFLYIIAPHSVNSPYCLKEVLLALKRHKRIIPLLHVDSIPYETWLERNPEGTEEEWEAYQAAGKHSSFPNMHPEIGKINWVYFREGMDDYDKSFMGLVDLMHRHEDYVQQHTFLLAQALEWERNHEQSRYLLTGSDRHTAKTWLLQRFKDEQPPCVPTDLHCEYICESEKHAENFMTDVFLSYSEQNKDIMHKVAKSLMREGFTLWTNKTDIKTGVEFQTEINRGIERADNVVFLISKDSLESVYCQQELAYAAQLNKRLVTLLIKPTDLELIPKELRSLQFIDISNSESEEQYAEGIPKLIKELQEDAVYYKQHKEILVQALKWQEQQKNASILYRGYRLQNAEAWLKLAVKQPRYPALPLHEEFLQASASQPPNQSLDVFIAHSPVDTDFARKLNEALQIQGKTTWFDQESIAADVDLQQELDKGIEQCDNFLFLISPDSVNAKDCLDQIQYATQLNKRFVAIAFRPVSESQLPPELTQIPVVDFKQHGGDFTANFTDLVRTLDVDRDHVKSHTKWLQRALEWEQKGKTNDLLLRGSEFTIAEAWLNEAIEQEKKPVPATVQQNLILDSRAAIEAEIRREKRREMVLRALLGLVSVVALIAIGVGAIAVRQNRALKISEIRAITTSTRALFALNRQLSALTDSIKAGTKLLKLGEDADPKLTQEVSEVLRETVYGSQVLNQLSGHHAPVMRVVYSPSGNYLASGSVDNNVKVWKSTGELLFALEGHNDSVLAIAFSPDEKLIATAGVDRQIKLWNIKGELITTLVGHLDQINDVVFMPDGDRLVSASSDKTAKIWSIERGKRLDTLTGHSDKVTTVAVSPDGQTIATGSQDKSIKLWDGEGKRLTTIEAHDDKVNAVNFSPDNKTLVSSSNDTTIKLWNVADGTLITAVGEADGTAHTDPVNDVVFSQDGRFIVSGSDDTSLKIWSSQGYLLTTLEGHTDRVTSVSINPDTRFIASSGLDNAVNIWKWEGTDLALTLYGHSRAVTGTVLDPQGKQLLSVGRDGLVRRWQWQLNPKKVQTSILMPEKLDAELVSLAVSPDRQLILAGDNDGNLYRFDAEGNLLETKDVHYDDVMAIAFSPDGKQFMTTGRDKVAKLWNADGSFVTRFDRHSDAVTGVAFSPDGTYIATSSWDNAVRLWNRDGKLLHILEGHEGSVLAVAISPDSKWIASSGGDNTIRIWDREGKAIQTIRDHRDSVTTLKFSPNGQWLASGSADTTVKLWSMDWQFITTFRGHTDNVTSLDFTSDSQYLVSGSEDNTIVIWDTSHFLNLKELLDEACTWTDDYLRYNELVNKDDRQLCEGI